MKFLDPDSPTDPPEPTDQLEDPQDPPAEPTEPSATESFDEIVESELGDEGGAKPGRPSLDKEGMAQLAEALIKDNVILPFDDDEKELKDYTLDDYKELFMMNFDSYFYVFR